MPQVFSGTWAGPLQLDALIQGSISAYSPGTHHFLQPNQMTMLDSI